MRKYLKLCFVIFGLLIFVASMAHAIDYTFIPIQAPDASLTRTFGINNFNYVVGASNQHGFLDIGGNFTWIDFPEASQTQAYGINDSNNIIGTYLDADWRGYGFLFDGETFIPINFPEASETYALGINSYNNIVGTYGDATLAPQGFLYEGGIFTSINYPGAYQTIAMGINNFGSIVGYYRDAMGHTHGFLYIAETFNSIDFPDASETYALGINDSGDIVGWYTPDNIYGAHGFLYTGGSFNTIDVPESSQTFAYGINNFGNIVGYFNDANGTYGFVAFSSPPSPPTDVQASDGTYMDKVQISWTPSLGTTSYTVYRATSSNTWARKTVLGTTSETFFNDNTAVPMSTYFYYVRASNVYGSSDFSSYDAGYCSDGTPPVPTNVQACDGTYLDKVEVTWDASAMATSYTVYRAASLSRRASKTNLGTASETHFNDTTAIPMKTYYYYVKASNTYGMSGYSAYDSGYRSDGRPPIPTNVAASDGAYIDKVEVTWTGSPEATSYTVYRATSTSRRATKVAIGTTTDTAYNDTTTLTGKTYYYWVKASNSYGESGYSAYDTGYR